MEANERQASVNAVAPYLRWAIRHGADIEKVNADWEAFLAATDTDTKCDALILAITDAKPILRDFPITPDAVTLSFDAVAAEPDVVAAGGAEWLEALVKILPIVVQFLQMLIPILFPPAPEPAPAT